MGIGGDCEAVFEDRGAGGRGQRDLSFFFPWEELANIGREG